MASILDGWNVVDKMDGVVKATTDDQISGIVGHCPKCGAPIYGQKTVKASEAPVVQHTCTCSWNKNLCDTVCTK